MPKVVQTDRFDERAYNNALTGSQDLQDLLQQGEQVSEGWGSFQDDIFQEHYQPKPELVPRDKLNKPFHQLVEGIRDTEEYKTVHGLTMNDVFNTTIATHVMGQDMMPKLSEKLTEEMTKRENLARRKRLVEEATRVLTRRMKREQDRKQEAAEDSEVTCGGWTVPGGDTTEPVDGAAPDDEADADPQTTQDELDDLATEGTLVQDEIDALEDIDFEDMIADARRAYRQAADNATDLLMYLSGAGNELGLNNRTMNLEAKKALAQRLTRSDKLRKIFEEAGRIQKIVGEKTANVIPDRREEKVGIRTGKLPVHDMLIEELALAGDPRSRTLFAKKYATESLLLRRWAGKEQLGAGPIIILRDDSGSMAGPKEIWAKAITLAFLSLAQRDKRDVYVMAFASGYDNRSWVFPYREKPQEVTWDLLLECLEWFINGGTNFEIPLGWARERIESAIKPGSHPTDKPWEKADVIMITDGLAPISATWEKAFMDKKQELGFHTFAVLLGVTADNLKKIIDSINPVNNLGKNDREFKMSRKDEENVIANLFTHATGGH